MALSLFLGEAGMTAETIDTKATVTLDQVGGGFAVTSYTYRRRRRSQTPTRLRSRRRPTRPRTAVLSPSCSTQRSRWRRSSLRR
jgi:hypothetical protein